ncbi:MAG: transcriptional regulator, AraC family [Massilibacillus sp.]|jgi:AraC-like DNA-binding protein|nr:transcriptional regulator, AraC family [Massilibacillus sp.]
MKQRETGKIYFFDFTKTIGVEVVSGNNIKHDFSRHTYRKLCLGIVKEGKRSLICQDHQYEIVRDNIFIIPTKISHSFCSGELACTYSLFMVSKKLLQMILPSENYKFNKVVLKNHEYYEQMLELEQLLISKESEFLKQSMLVKILGDIINECTLFIEPITMQYQQKEAVDKVKQFIDTHYKKNFTLSALAKIACLSPYYFIRVFTNTIGIPPHMYQQQVRIRAAKEMLSKGNNIAGIATTLGFTDQSHFSNVFKKLMGITPKNYMKDTVK